MIVILTRGLVVRGGWVAVLFCPRNYVYSLLCARPLLFPPLLIDNVSRHLVAGNSNY